MTFEELLSGLMGGGKGKLDRPADVPPSLDLGICFFEALAAGAVLVGAEGFATGFAAFGAFLGGFAADGAVCATAPVGK